MFSLNLEIYDMIYDMFCNFPRKISRFSKLLILIYSFVNSEYQRNIIVYGILRPYIQLASNKKTKQSNVSFCYVLYLRVFMYSVFALFISGSLDKDETEREFLLFCVRQTLHLKGIERILRH